MDTSGYSCAAAAGPRVILESNDITTRAEACLCDADPDSGTAPAAAGPEEDVSGALVDRGPVAISCRQNSSRTTSLLRRGSGLGGIGGAGQVSPAPSQPSPLATRTPSLLGQSPQQSRRRYQAHQQQQSYQQQPTAEQELQEQQLGQVERRQFEEQQQQLTSDQQRDPHVAASLQEVPCSYDVSGDVSGGATATTYGGGDRSHHRSLAWMDAGSVWSSVQRHGEELQRRQRAAGGDGAATAPPQRRLTVVGAAVSTCAAWRRGPIKRFLQRVRTQFVLTARVAAKDPTTVIVPVVLLVCLLALGLWGTFSVAYTVRDGRRQAALNAATDFANTLKSHIAATMAPAYTVKTLIEMQPNWPDINKTFHERAPDLVRKGRESDAVLTIVMVPQGIASAIVPTGLPAWDKVYGLDLLREPAWRKDALKTVQLHKQGMVMTGPSVLRAGMMGIVTRHAVFVPGGPNDTFGFNGTAFNCSYCFEPGSGPNGEDMRFWGFAQLNVDWNVLIHNVTRMDNLCERENLALRMTYINPVNGSNVTVAGCGGEIGSGNNPLVVQITTMQNTWMLAVSDERGWTPDWLPVVVAVVVVLSLWVSVAMAIILINRREHMWLLQAMLPKKVIATLRRGEEYAEAFECVTVLFSDIVSYTTLASELEPIKVVRLLNAMYSEYDALVDQFECYKVETIGDAFMAVCGTQGESAVAAAVKMARLAQAMIERTRVLVSADGQKIQIRIGLHSGPVVGAVVGFKMPHFCLCGDTVNTASRMESNSRPMRIHISDSTAALLAASGEGFVLERRGLIQVKGKGPMLTHWLLPPGNGDGGGACGDAGSGAAAAGDAGGVAEVPADGTDAATAEGQQAMESASKAAERAEVQPPLDAAMEAAAESAEGEAAAAPTEAAPWSAPAAGAQTTAPSLGETPFAFTTSAAGDGNFAGGVAATPAVSGKLSHCPSMGGPMPTGGCAANARRRFSEIGAGSGAPCGRALLPSFLAGLVSVGGGSNGGSPASGGGGAVGPKSSSGVGGPDGGGGGGTVTMTCSGSGAASRRPRASVDLRIFQMSSRHSKGK